jgi:hypothetical protein
MTDSKEYNVDVASKILRIEPENNQRLIDAVVSAGAQVVRVDPPRFTVRVTASSESEAQTRAVEALERWASGPGAGWRPVGATQWQGEAS